MSLMADETFTAVDLSRLPSPDIIELLDFDTIYADALARMVVLMPDFEARESDPATKQLLILAYFAQLLRQRVNDAARAVMPAHAVGADLDNIAAIFGVTRFTLTPADTATGTPAVMESDADFRRRVVLGPEGYSVAGPEGAYIFHALSADPNVLDAAATTPTPDSIRTIILGVLDAHGASADLRAAMVTALSNAVWPGQVIVSIMSRDSSGAASPALVATVDDYLSDVTRRPLTDAVTVQPAAIVNYAVVATLYTFRGPDAEVVRAAALARLETYVAQCHRLGRDVTRSGIFAALHVDGVQRVELTAPAADIVISRQQAPYCTAIDVSFAGVGE